MKNITKAKVFEKIKLQLAEFSNEEKSEILSYAYNHFRIETGLRKSKKDNHIENEKPVKKEIKKEVKQEKTKLKEKKKMIEDSEDDEDCDEESEEEMKDD